MANPFVALKNYLLGPGSPPVEAGIQSNLTSSIASGETSVTFDSAMTISAFWGCTRILSESIGSLPLSIYEIVDGEKRISTGDVAKVLTKKPNRYQSPVEFWECMGLNLAVAGNAYAYKQRVGPRLVGLLPLSASQTRPELLPDGSVVYHHTQGGNVKVFSAENIWHIKLFGSPLIGLSPLSYAARSINVAQNADNRTNKIYSNGAKPSGVLTIDHTLTKEQRAQVRENFADLEEGNEDRLFVLEADMQYQQVSMAPKDIELLESRRFQIEDIGRFFGVPSILLNQTFGQSSLGSNVAEIMQGFYKVGLRPYLEKIESSIKRWLLPDGKEWDVRFDFDALLRADTLTRMQANREGIYSGQLTPNEARELEGRGPLDGGELLYIQGATVPLEEQAVTPLVSGPPADPDETEMRQIINVNVETKDGGSKSVELFSRDESGRIIKAARSEDVNTVIDRVAEMERQLREMLGDVGKSALALEAVRSLVKEHGRQMTEQAKAFQSVTIEPAPVTVQVVDNHPKRAVQRVERDKDDEITRTIIDYEK